MKSCLLILAVFVALSGCDKSKSKACVTARASAQALDAPLMEAMRTAETANLDLSKAQATLLAASTAQAQAVQKSEAAATVATMSAATAERKAQVAQAAIDSITAVTQAKVAVDQAALRVENTRKALDTMKADQAAKKKAEEDACGK